MLVSVEGTKNKYREGESLPRVFLRQCELWRQDLLRAKAPDPVLSVTAGRKPWVIVTLRSGARWMLPAQDSCARNETIPRRSALIRAVFPNGLVLSMGTA
jgi:hypothetical protein